LYVCDLDEDGDQDVVAGSGWAGVNQVNWYENTGTAITENHDQRVPRNFAGPTIIRGPLLPLIGENANVYDITGKKIESHNPSPGIYFLRIDDNNIQKVIRIN
jgi:hypothetical protein